jgi:hypothetical protein
MEADGTQITGEIEASVKDVNKRTTTYCGYFTDGYMESMGHYFDDSPVAEPTESDLLDFCLEEFPNRSTRDGNVWSPNLTSVEGPVLLPS